MKQSILFSLLGILVCGFTITAQEESLPETIPFYYHTNAYSAEAVDLTFETFTTLLAKYDLTLEFVENPDDAEVDLFLDSLTYDSVPAVFTVILNTTYPQPINDISPILYRRQETVTQSLIYEDEQALKVLITTILYGRARYEDALDLLSSVETSDQDMSGTYFRASLLQGDCYLMLGDYEGALLAYQQAHEWELTYLSQPSLPLVTDIAWVYLQLNQQDEAFALIQNTLDSYESTPGNLPYETIVIVNILTNRAQLYALALEYDLAIADMDNAIELAETDREDFSPTDLAELYVLRGQMVILLYEWDRVLENYNTALALDSEYAPAYYYRGLLYYSVLEREDALADFEHYLSIAPDEEFAGTAQTYAESIRIELEALEN